MSEVKMSELKPCPFCGGVDIRFTNKTTGGRGNQKRHVAMYCNQCNTYGKRTLVKTDKPYLTSKERESFGISVAISAWNTRTDSNQKRIEELEGGLALSVAWLQCDFEFLGSPLESEFKKLLEKTNDSNN